MLNLPKKIIRKMESVRKAQMYAWQKKEISRRILNFKQNLNHENILNINLHIRLDS